MSTWRILDDYTQPSFSQVFCMSAFNHNKKRWRNKRLVWTKNYYRPQTGPNVLMPQDHYPTWPNPGPIR